MGSTDQVVDHWFKFESGGYAAVAESVVPYLQGQAVLWWDAA
ncbi:MAG: hypothetical protein WD872_08820 [Pirellulaceae bacterium]